MEQTASNFSGAFRYLTIITHTGLKKYIPWTLKAIFPQDNIYLVNYLGGPDFFLFLRILVVQPIGQIYIFLHILIVWITVSKLIRQTKYISFYTHFDSLNYCKFLPDEKRFKIPSQMGSTWQLPIFHCGNGILPLC